MRNLNLFLAILWAVLGAGAILYHQQNPQAFGADFGGLGISAGWLAGLLVLYNLVRWWSIRTYYSDRQGLQSVMDARRQRERAEERHHREEPPDPNLDFSDKPAGSRPGSEDGAT
jgi:hypothetical protein